MDDTYNISIGKDQWIKWVFFDPAKAQPVSIDEPMSPLKNFWRALEINCVAGCCGIDAFSFWPEDIRTASAVYSENDLLEQLDLLIRKITPLKDQILVSSQLNNVIHGSVFLKLLDHINSILAHDMKE